MDEYNKINVTLLNSYEKDFSKEFNNFNIKTYNALNASYLSYCSDPLIRIMYKTLHNHLLKIQRGYSNIDSWWKDYNDNTMCLENYLCGYKSVGSISEPSIRNFVSKLPDLRNYNINFSGSINTSNSTIPVSKIFSGSISSVNIKESFSNIYRNEYNKIANSNLNYAFSQINSKKEDNDAAEQVLKKVGATTSLVVTSALEGVAEFWEDALNNMKKVISKEPKSIFEKYDKEKNQISFYKKLKEEEKIAIFRDSELDFDDPAVEKTIQNILNSEYDEEFLSIIGRNLYLNEMARLQIAQHLTGKQIIFMLSQDIEFCFPKTIEFLSNNFEGWKTVDVSILIKLLDDENEFELFQKNFNENDIYVDNITKADIIYALRELRGKYGYLRNKHGVINIYNNTRTTRVYNDFFDQNLEKTLILDRIFPKTGNNYYTDKIHEFLKNAQEILNNKYNINISNEEIENAFLNTRLLNVDEFAAFIDSRSVGGVNMTVNGINTTIINGKFDNTTMFNTIVTHELIHFLSRPSAYEIGFQTNEITIAFNEASTQLITKIILGESFQSDFENCTYEFVSIMLKSILDLNISGFDEKTFVQAYFNNDTESIEKAINDFTGVSDYFENKLVPAFDLSLNGGDNSVLESLVRDLAILVEKGK